MCIRDSKYVFEHNLNHLEAKKMAAVITHLKSEISYVDSCDVNATRFGREISDLSNKSKVRSYHYADSRFVVVSAASIIAKVSRDRSIAQPEQTKIAIDNCKMYLKKGGFLFLVIKTRSIDVTKDPNQIINQEMKKLENDFEICEKIDLRPFDKDHAMVIAKSIN